MHGDLSGLTALLAVARKRSFTAAAAELRVTPSAVSQSVSALEKRLGVRLLQRTTRNVGLTEAGARFIARLTPAVNEINDAFDSLGELRDRPAGQLRLTLPRLAYEHILAPKIPGFLADYPDIELDLSIDDAFVNLVEHRFDAGLRIGEMIERDMIRVRVSGDLRMAVVGSPAYFHTRGRPKHPRDLHAHDCINYRRRSLGVVYRWEFTENGKDFETAVEGRILVNDGGLMVSLALEGMGLAYVPDTSVREHLAAKRLVRVLDDFCEPFAGFFLYYPSRAHVAPKLQALVHTLRVKAPRSQSGA